MYKINHISIVLPEMLLWVPANAHMLAGSDM